MKLASINMRKGANNPQRLSSLQRWLSEIDFDILIVQEPVAKGASLPPVMHRLHLVEGDARLACWSRLVGIIRSEAHSVPAIKVETPSAVICCTYLSASSSATRITQLRELCRLLRQPGKPIILLGDFNLAPSLEDGRFGDAASDWTKKGERKALGELVDVIGLADLTSLASSILRSSASSTRNGRVFGAILHLHPMDRAARRTTITMSG